MLSKNKNIIAKLKNQKGGLIQDGDEIIFLFFTKLLVFFILWLYNIDFILL
jgi:hypothetical protein